MIFRVLHYNPLSANELRLEEILQATRNFSIVGLVATQRRAPCLVGNWLIETVWMHNCGGRVGTRTAQQQIVRGTLCSA